MNLCSRNRNRNWKCGCEMVCIEIRCEPIADNIVCFCDDCNNRIRIGKTKASELGQNRFSRTGGVCMVSVPAKGIKITQGKDYINYFRAGVKNEGSEFDASSRTLNAYAKCCGTLILHIPEAHPRTIQLQPWGLDGWIEEDDNSEQMYFDTYYTKITHKEPPDGVLIGKGPVQWGNHGKDTILKVLKSMLVPPNLDPWNKAIEIEFDMLPPPEAYALCGKRIEYIENPLYLY